MEGMDHPGLSTIKIKKDMTIPQIQEKLNELNGKLSIAYGANQQLAYQLELAINTYNRAYQEMLDEQYGDGPGPGHVDIT